MGNKCYINHSGKYIEINFNMKIPFQLQSFFLVADDIMDSSEMRRGKPSWHCKDNIGTSAFNDAILLEAGVYKLLQKHFRKEPYYTDLLELFHEVRACFSLLLLLLLLLPLQNPFIIILSQSCTLFELG